MEGMARARPFVSAKAKDRCAAHLADRAPGGGIPPVGDVVDGARQVAVRNELLDEVQRQVHEGSAPSLHSHPQYAQQTCAASCSLSAAGSSKQYLISPVPARWQRMLPPVTVSQLGISRLPRAQALPSGAGTYFGHSGSVWFPCTRYSAPHHQRSYEERLWPPVPSCPTKHAALVSNKLRVPGSPAAIARDQDSV